MKNYNKYHLSNTINFVIRFIRQFAYQLMVKLLPIFFIKQDVVRMAQLVGMSNWYKVDGRSLSKLLGGRKLGMLDVGARGGIDPQFEKYEDCFQVVLVEPDQIEAELLRKKGYVVIDKLIGGSVGHGTLNLCRKLGVSSMLEPSGAFLEFYAQGRKERFDVIKRIELPVTTIADVMQISKFGLDYLKLDTQGTELDILKGMGDIRPLVIKSEISFVPIYDGSANVYEIGSFLYDRGYLTLGLSYSSAGPGDKYLPSKGRVAGEIPMHGDAYFVADWTREEGKK